MAQDRAWLHPRQRAAHQMQIGAADGIRRQPHNGVVRFFDFRFSNLV